MNLTTYITAAAILALLTSAGYATGQDQEDDSYLGRLHKTNPNELFVDVGYGSDCKLPEEAIKNMIDGILTRSRVKRLTSAEWLDVNLDFDQLHMNVFINCDGHIFSNDVRFADLVQRPSITSVRLMLHYRPYGGYGIYNGDTEYLMDSVKESVERALTDYLKANFDL